VRFVKLALIFVFYFCRDCPKGFHKVNLSNITTMGLNFTMTSGVVPKG